MDCGTLCYVSGLDVKMSDGQTIANCARCGGMPQMYRQVPGLYWVECRACGNTGLESGSEQLAVKLWNEQQTKVAG